MALTDKPRTSLPLQSGLRRVPLRTKLVASVLVLVFAALALISASSTYPTPRRVWIRRGCTLSTLRRR